MAITSADIVPRTMATPGTARTATSAPPHHHTTGEDYRRHAAAVAEGFTAWPGLLGKVWLGERDRNRYGGVCLFATRADADRSRSTPLFAGLAGNPALTDLAIEEFETLPEATAVTWPGLRGPTGSALAAG